jgi:uncharacterized protein YcaQ
LGAPVDDFAAMTGLERLRLYAISQSLFPRTTLKAAIRRLGFVQADPIRSPARAQDLILRHRVKGYGAGDLERRYTSLDVEEDTLYAYGFLPRTVWHLLHPRNMKRLSALEKKVLEAVRGSGPTHPRALQKHFGSARVINAWGSHSRATTQALEQLHHRGLLRIAGRENGIRIYDAAPPFQESLSPVERLRRLVMVIATILAPIPEKSLYSNVTRYRTLGNPRTIVRDLLKTGELETESIDGTAYLWPHAEPVREAAPLHLRFLAPFDPLVWDRQRFEHFWGWPYRFEAYTPPAKRVRGYYAMPLLWRDDVIGWVNSRFHEGRLDVEVGFVVKQPDEEDFQSELDREVACLEMFLLKTTDR